LSIGFGYYSCFQIFVFANKIIGKDDDDNDDDMDWLVVFFNRFNRRRLMCTIFVNGSY